MSDRRSTRAGLVLSGLCITGLLGVLASASSAYACTMSACTLEELWPRNGRMPANAGALLWQRADFRTTAPPVLHLRQVTDPGPTEVPVRMEPVLQDGMDHGLVRVIPEVPLAPGVRYELTVESTCHAPEREHTFAIDVTEPMAPPRVLGALRVQTAQGVIEVNDDPSCGRDASAAYADIDLTLSEEAVPYAGMLRYLLLADDQVTYGAPRGKGPANFRVYALCDEEQARYPGLTPGRHRVAVRALLPDDSLIETHAVKVDLRCASRPAAPPPARAARCSTRLGNESQATYMLWLSVWGVLWRRRTRANR